MGMEFTGTTVAASRHWAIIKAYLERATPRQWHLFAARSDYDSNRQDLQWLLDQRNLDHATALMIYWNLGAAWFVQYASEEEAPDSENFRMLRLIEERYNSGYYENGRFWFDPMESAGGGPDDYPDVPVKRPVPPTMLLPVNGTEYVNVERDPPGFEEGLPTDVVGALHALFDGA